MKCWYDLRTQGSTWVHVVSLTQTRPCFSSSSSHLVQTCLAGSNPMYTEDAVTLHISLHLCCTAFTLPRHLGTSPEAFCSSLLLPLPHWSILCRVHGSFEAAGQAPLFFSFKPALRTQSRFLTKALKTLNQGLTHSSPWVRYTSLLCLFWAVHLCYNVSSHRCTVYDWFGTAGWF